MPPDPLLQITPHFRLREFGLIETRMDVRNRTEAKLTPNALQRLAAMMSPQAEAAQAL